MCKDGEAMASRAVLAAHSSMPASTMTGEASNNEQEVLLPEASLDQLSPLLSVLHGLQIDQVDQQCAKINFYKIYLRIGQMILSSWLCCWDSMPSLL